MPCPTFTLRENSINGLRSRIVAMAIAAIVLAPGAAFADDPAPEAPKAPSPPPPPPIITKPANPTSFTYSEEDTSAKRIPFRDGDPVPQGYRVQSSTRMGVLAGGIVMGSALWTISTVAAIVLDKQESVDGDPNFGDKYWPMFIPVIGPFITIKTADSSGTGAAILALDGALQVGALAMIITSIAAPKLELVPQRAITIGPIAGSDRVGVQIGGAF
jgi:hypothetical protein